VILLEGNVSLKMKEYDKALKKAEDILKIDPGCEEAYMLLISIYQAKNKLQEAIRAADNGLNHCENGTELKMVKAKILRSIGRETEALQLASQISTSEPNNFKALELLAYLYHDLGDISAAEMTAKKSIRLSQNQPDLQLLLGRILIQKGNLDQALEYLSKSAALLPGDVEACLEIGKVYLEQQDLASALDSFKEAIERNPKDYRAFYQAGLIMKEIKDYQGAEKMLKLAAELAPKDANIRRQLAGVMALNFVHSPMEVN
jgi:tetratricopeptide (TPR) repeat protein